MAWVPGLIIPSPPCSLGEQKRRQDGAGLLGRMNGLIMLTTFLNLDSGGERTQSVCQSLERMRELTMTALPKTESVCWEWMLMLCWILRHLQWIYLFQYLKLTLAGAKQNLSVLPDDPM